MSIPDFTITGMLVITLMSFAVLVIVLVAMKNSKDEHDRRVKGGQSDVTEV